MQDKLENAEKAKLLIEFIRVAQEGAVRPDTGQARDKDSVCNTTGVVRDAGYAKKYITGAMRELGRILNFEAEDLDKVVWER